MATRGFEHVTRADVERLQRKQPVQKRSKYRNVKVVIDGEVFDSKREAAYWQGLKAREAAKEIRDLEHHVLLPLKAPTISVIGATVVVAYYEADFVYFDAKGFRHVVDAKGKRTQMYQLKKRWLLLQDAIEIEEV